MGCYTYLAIVEPAQGYDRLHDAKPVGEEIEDDLEIKGYGIPSTLLFGEDTGVQAVQQYDPTDDYEVRYRYDVEKLRANAQTTSEFYARDFPGGRLQVEAARVKIDRFINAAERLQKEYGDRAVIVVNV